MAIVLTEKGKKVRTLLSHAKKIVICALLAGGGWYAYQQGWLNPPAHQEASVPPQSSLMIAPVPAPTTVVQEQTYAQVPGTSSARIPMASSLLVAPATSAKLNVTLGTIPWIAAANALGANEGAVTKPGSLVDKAGVRMTMKRYDDYGPFKTGLLEFAQALHDGKSNPEKYGMQFAVVMHNGGPNFFAGLNKELKRFGPDYIAETIAPIGASRGEDKCMATPEIRDNPQLARGKFFSGEKGDGDQDICLAWFQINKVPVNVDESVYDPNAANWVSASFIGAVRKWNIGDCGAWRPTLGNPEKKVQECLSALGTWLPGDKQVSDGIGGLVTLASTKDFPSLMSADLVGIRKWGNANRATVDNLLVSFYKEGELIKESDDALLEAGRVATEVFGEGNPEYWRTYYHGKTEVDKKGNENEIGGSFTYGLADALEYAGLLPGKSNSMAAYYDDRGAVMEAMYPDLFPDSFPKAAEVINYSYLKDIQNRIPTMSAPVLPVYSDAPIQQVVGNASWQITFATGKATFNSDAVGVLTAIWKVTGEARALKIAVYGHTDNVGNSTKNLALSKKRAQAVVAWLKNKSPDLFPSSRFTAVDGFGDTQPIASNATEEGRSQNRRVQIVVGR